MIARVLLLAVAAGLSVSALGAPKPAEQGLLDANTRWLTAVNAYDNKTGIGLMTGDAMLIGAVGPVSAGRAEVKKRVEQLTSAPGFHVDFHLTHVSLGEGGTTGVVIGDAVITPPGGHSPGMPGRLVTVWRRQAGHWLCYLDIVIPTPSGSAPN